MQQQQNVSPFAQVEISGFLCQHSRFRPLKNIPYIQSTAFLCAFTVLLASSSWSSSVLSVSPSVGNLYG